MPYYIVFNKVRSLFDNYDSELLADSELTSVKIGGQDSEKW